MKQEPTYGPMELLRQWIQGDARQEDERQLEQLAAGDPFLADALQGLNTLPDGNHAERVERIRAFARERGQKRRGLVFYLPRAAAAAVVIGLLAGGFWYINSGRASRPVAMERQEKEASPTPPPADSSAPQSMASDEALPGAPGPESSPEAEKPESPAPEKAGKEGTPQTAQVQPKMEKAAPAEETAAGLAAGEARPSAPQAEQADALRSRSQPAQPTPGAGQVVRGRVVDDSGQPLIGANVTVPGTTRGAVTDENGNFQLSLPEGASQIEVAYTGYQSVRREVKAGSSVNVSLSESLALEEVVVTGYESKAKKQAAPPKPSVGANRYKRYIRTNLRYPDTARRNGVEGEVEVSFQVQPDGSLSGFKVLRGLGQGCNEEAIRLLREGPKWEGAGQQGAFVVEFKLK